jgi:peptidyl-prolyl cis-trans isomerase D
VAKSAVVDRAVADAAFELKAGEVSQPVQGRFGIAIVKVDSIEAGAIKPFEEIAADLKRDMAADRAKNELVNVQEKIEDERLGGATLADAAKKYGLSPRVIEAIDRSGKDPQGNTVELPQNADVLTPAFNAEVHGEAEPLRLTGNAGYVWFDVDAIIPSRDRPLEEVKDQVLTRWRDDEVTNRLRAKAAEMLDKVKAGTPLNDVAAAENLKPEWRPGIKRGSPPAGISAAAAAEVFKTPLNAAGSAEGTIPTDRVVFHVTEIKVPPLEPDGEQARRIIEALSARATEDLIAQYLVRVQSDVGVTINQSALDQVSGGGTQN